ncbi:hypothetical protein Nocox_28440 [Nonomuraea coxensis DSM 45129]|uniref:Uncharacterized protein n=1 Tax=Nonomuraea coxensis DSM 45129 TaxID=1122611 RepID=A0ABX8U6A5_9ACTN|nr:hypothetical protein [Nonomuraea coxensis]QYC43277.1 hypothetical protein Nocox_28440 [Nonomuraea coxensis DSM 45129]
MHDDPPPSTGDIPPGPGQPDDTPAPEPDPDTEPLHVRDLFTWCESDPPGR